MKIGIVGSRRRNTDRDRRYVFELVEYLIKTYDDELVLVSGGCPDGADGFAEQAADFYGVSMLVHYPAKWPKASTYGEATSRFYARNLKIAKDSDILYALAATDRTGGTENTIGYMKKLGKVVWIIDEAGQKTEDPLLR